MSLRRIAAVAACAYLAILHLAVAVLIFKTDFLVRAGKTLGLLPPEEWNEPLYQGILALGERNRGVPPGAVVLIGDSLVAQLDPGLIGSDVFNLGLGGETTVTLRRHLAALTALDSAREIVLLVGVNDFKYREEAEIAADYAALLRDLPQHVPLLVLSILPIDERADEMRARPYLKNQRFRVINARIRQQCAEQPRCRYLDAWPAMTGGAEGGAAVPVFAADGWHLGPVGNRLLANLIAGALRHPP